MKVNKESKERILSNPPSMDQSNENEHLCQSFLRNDIDFTVDDNKLKQSSNGRGFLQNYRISEYIGKGAFGVVCKS